MLFDKTLPQKSILILAVLLLLLLSGLMLISIKNPPSLDDGLRHFAIAKEMRERGEYFGGVAWSDFFYEGYFAERAVDPWYLSNILYVPFSFLPPQVAVRAFSFTGIAALLASFLWLLRPMKISAGWLALFSAILILGDRSFLFRIFLGRPFIIMTAVILLTVKGVLEKRAVLAAVCIFFAVLLSELYMFPLFIALLGSLWIWRAFGARSAVKMFSGVSAGALAGLAAHPHAAEYISHTLGAFLKIPFSKGIKIGMEMYSGVFSVTSSTALIGSAAMFAVFCIVFAPKADLRKWHREGVTFLAAITAVFYAFFFIWMRAIDILWPLEIVLLALIIKCEPDKAFRLFAVSPFTSKYRNTTSTSLSVNETAILPFIAVLLAAVNYLSVFVSFRASDESKSLSIFESLQTVPAGSKVLNLEWDIFPPLMAVRPDLKYATGIVSTYTYLDDPKAYKLLRTAWPDPGEYDASLIDGGKWAEAILGRYPSDYLVLSKSRFPQFIYSLREADVLKEMTESGSEMAVFEVTQ